MTIYLFGAGFLYMFYRKARAMNHDACFDNEVETHHRVHAVLKMHPRGGTWSEFQGWMADARTKSGERS